MSMTLRSSAWEAGGEIPARFTGFGGAESPPLVFSGAPAGTQCFARICTDLDSFLRPFVHWVVYDIPGTADGLPAAVARDAPVLADGSCQGTGGLGERGYIGPRPPRGRHRYRFRLYALREPVAAPPGLKAKELEQMIRDRVIASADLIGTCTRP